jgi:hypothetical protein
MEIQYVSTYISMSEKGLVEKLLCPVDQASLMPNLGLDDEIFLYCLSCSYKVTMGVSKYNQIKSKVDWWINSMDNIENESKPMPVTDSMGREKFWEDLGRQDD